MVDNSEDNKAGIAGIGCCYTPAQDRELLAVANTPDGR